MLGLGGWIMKARNLALLALLISGTATAEPPARQPTDKWVVNFADAQCVASRAYSLAEESVFLVLKLPPLGDLLQISVVRRGSKNRVAQGNGELQLGTGSPIRVSVVSFENAKSGKNVLLANLPEPHVEKLASATEVRIRASDGIKSTRSRIGNIWFSADESFAVGQMAPVLKLLRECAGESARNVEILG